MKNLKRSSWFIFILAAILFSVGVVSANAVAPTFISEIFSGGLLIGFILLFIVNYPINLSLFIILFLFFNRKKVQIPIDINPKDFIFYLIFTIAIITLIGAFIDTVVFNSTSCFGFIYGLIFIWFSYLIFSPILIKNYSLALKIGFCITIVNALSWILMMNPIFYCVSGLFIVFIFISAIILLEKMYGWYKGLYYEDNPSKIKQTYMAGLEDQMMDNTLDKK